MINNCFETFDHHLLQDEKPSLFFNSLTEENLDSSNKYLDYLFCLKKIEQNPKYHPEGCVWNHTMDVIDLGAKHKAFSQDPPAFMWGCLLHDIGKSTTTRIKKGRIISYDHDKEGAKLSRKFLELYTKDQDFIRKVTVLVKWHMQPFLVAKDLPFADVSGMLKDISPSEVGLFSFCDRLGRGKVTAANRQSALQTISKFFKETLKRVDNQEEIDRINKVLAEIEKEH